jgi:hypothetical protein
MREPKLGVAVGRKGVGKTYTTNNMIASYVNGNPLKSVKPRRVLILDVNDEFEDIKALRLKDVIRFSAHPTIEARRIRPFREDGMRMTLNEVQDALFKILQTFRGGMLLIEDINRYVSDNLPNDLIGAICTNRHTDTDIIMHFQSIGRITPKIWQNLNWLRFHKNSDSVDKHRTKFEDKYEYLKIAEMLVNQKYNNGDKRYYLYVDLDDEKLIGNISKTDIKNVITEYISKYYKKVINPLLAQRDMDGRQIYNPNQAVAEVKNRIIKEFFTK